MYCTVVSDRFPEFMENYILLRQKEISFDTHLLVVTYYVHMYSVTIAISSLVHHVRPDDGLIKKKGRNMLSIF